MNLNESPLELLERAAAAREKQPPSARNREIAQKVRVLGLRQVDVAAEYKLSQRRVSQICRQVANWHGCTAAWERGELDGPVRRRAERVLRRQQLDEVVVRSMRAFGRSEQPLVTRRKGQRPGGKWSERSEREQRLDTSSLRVALRAIEQRGKLAEQVDPRENEATEQMDYLKWVLGCLAAYRRQAEMRGDVPQGDDPQVLVERLVRELLVAPPAASAECSQPQTLLGKPAVAPSEAWEGEAPAEQTLLGKPAVAPNGDEQAPINCINRRGVEARVEAECGNADEAASAEPATCCDQPPREEATLEEGEKNRDGSGPPESRLERLLAGNRRLSPVMRQRLTGRLERRLAAE